MRSKRKALWLTWMIVIWLLSSCSNQSFQVTNSLNLAKQKGYKTRYHLLADMELFSLIKKVSNEPLVHIYIEGDGFAWKTKNTPSGDPTPKFSLVLQFITKDMHPSVVYLARPGQFPRDSSSLKMPYALWTSHRYSEQNVSTMNHVISAVKNEAGAQRIILIGHSGGGAMAMLIGALRSDIEKVVTIGANLDHDKWTRHHKVTPLHGSLNPLNFIEYTKNIQQCHYYGTEDEIVPFATISDYAEQTKHFSSVSFSLIESADHTNGWLPQWEAIISSHKTIKQEEKKHEQR